MPVLKKLAKHLLLGPAPISQWAPIGVRLPQRQVRVWLESDGERYDATNNCSVAALRPLTLVTCPPAGVLHSESRRRLVFTDSDHGERVLGAIGLKVERIVEVHGYPLVLLRTHGHANYCVSPLRLRMHYLKQEMQNRRNRDPFNFRMPPADLHALLVFYTCPRPVSLVAVFHDGLGNVFPMDLVGPSASPFFTMALRSTSPSVGLMRGSKRMALSDIPILYKQIAYDLGKHHNLESVDLSSLPFETRPSPNYGLPVACESLSIREVRVVDCHTVGSHHLFVTEIIHEDRWAEGLRMCHVQGFYENYLRRFNGNTAITSSQDAGGRRTCS